MPAAGAAAAAGPSAGAAAAPLEVTEAAPGVLSLAPAHLQPAPAVAGAGTAPWDSGAGMFALGKEAETASPSQAAGRSSSSGSGTSSGGCCAARAPKELRPHPGPACQPQTSSGPSSSEEDGRGSRGSGKRPRQDSAATPAGPGRPQRLPPPLPLQQQLAQQGGEVARPPKALPAVAGAVGGARLMLQLRHHARQPAAQVAGLNLSLVAAFLAAYQVRQRG
jgi:hypothetical protein